MADSKVENLTAVTDLADEDLFHVVDDPSGTPTSKKVTYANLFKLPAIADPSAPGAGYVRFYGKNVAGRILPKWVGPAGLDTPVQPAFFGNNIAMWMPNTGTSVSTELGTPWTARNAGTSAVQGTPTIATTSLYTMMKRATFGTGTTSTGSSGTQSTQALVARGNAAGIGGFFFFARIGVDPTNFVNTVRIFVGLSQLNAALAGEPSAQNNSIVLGCDAADTNWQVITRNGSTSTKTDCGAAIAANDILDFYIFCKPNDSKVTVRVVKQTTSGATVLLDNVDLSSNLPTNTAVLWAHAQIMSTAGSTAKSLALNRIYVETDI